MDYLSWLLYGFTASGKTYTALSSFWDFEKGEQICEGRWLRFGRENNVALSTEIPGGLIKTFRSPTGQHMQYHEDFQTYLRGAVQQARKQGHPEVFVVDGLSEWASMYIQEHLRKHGETDKFKRWNEIKEALKDIVQLLSPEELGAHVICTARIEEKRKGIEKKGGGMLTEADPEFVDVSYYPSMEGKWSRLNLGYYFDMIFYMEEEMGTITLPDRSSTVGSYNRLNMIQTGDYLVKNPWKTRWLRSKAPGYLLNPTFGRVLEAIGAQIKATPAGESE